MPDEPPAGPDRQPHPPVPRAEPADGADPAPAPGALRLSAKRLALALAVAVVSDVVGAFATPLQPVVWAVDVATVVLLFVTLGRQWLLLPGLVMEAIPGVGVLPIWTLVAVAIAVWGTAHPNLKRLRSGGGERTPE